MAAAAGPLPPGPLAVPCTYTFVPEEAKTEYLLGFVEGRYDSMNLGEDKLVEQEREMARAELRRRGIPVPAMIQCGECGGDLVAVRREGRTRSYRGKPGYVVPAGMPILTCPDCSTEWLTTEQLDELSKLFESQNRF